MIDRRPWATAEEKLTSPFHILKAWHIGTRLLQDLTPGARRFEPASLGR